MTYDNFGFDSEEFLGQAKTVPYAQFINSSNKVFGLGITSANAEIAEFELADGWEIQEVEFSDGTEESVILTRSPRLLVLNKSQALMSSGSGVEAYNKTKYQEGGYKAFSYAVVWFLNKENKPLSNLPFRLKLSGYAGITFLKNYEYYNEQDCFTRQFLKVYKELSGDKATDKNRVFYAHSVFNFKLDRLKATSSYNGQSSFAVQTTQFLAPTTENFGSLIIKNGTETSDRIKELIETTKSWIDFDDKPQTMITEEAEELNQKDREAVQGFDDAIASDQTVGVEAKEDSEIPF